MAIKYIIILSLLLFIGCNKSSTSVEECNQYCCRKLEIAYADTSTAYEADPDNKELCDANLAAYLALIDADCQGYTDAPQITSTCDDLLTGKY